MIAKTTVLLRRIAKIAALVFLGVFLVFFIFEGGIGGLSGIEPADAVLLLFIPVLFAAGTVVSFFSELWGGVIMLLSVIGFNIALGCFFGSYEFEFWFFLIPALMLIIYSFLTKRKFNIDK